MNRKDVQLILKNLNIEPTKRLGQNFLIDNNTRDTIINQARVSQNDIILEIGPGLGALTEKLVESAKKVYAIEIDSRLFKFLRNKFSNYNNLTIINSDILQFDLPEYNKVVSNLPYSITGQILEKIFFRENPPHGILTIEEAIADRIFSQKNYKNLSRITISVNTFMKPVEKRKISRNSFYPTPNIDLTLINLFPREIIDEFLIEKTKRLFYLKILSGIMPFKNKNLSNALELFLKKKLYLDLNKKIISNILHKNNIIDNKVYRYSISDFVKISKIFYDEIELKEMGD
ncbi:MAG: 16S rRNA (adenine(1518)-N(6)/adenine(1519)-N(6))-dimethyltransferase RsmA [Promethearchaeota archaeon]